VLRTSRNDHDVALAADPLVAAEAKLHLAFEHPHDLLICVTVRLDMDALELGEHAIIIVRAVAYAQQVAANC
jgi:hypothetical protein